MMFKLKGLTAEEVQEKILPPGSNELILLTYRGSISHGTYRPSTDPNSIDDKDLMGVFIPPIEDAFGFGRKKLPDKMYKEWDVVHYAFKKLVSLLYKANPNVLSLLWCEEKHVIFSSTHGDVLRAHRDLFATKKAYHSFCGYARSQLKRMTINACEGYMGKKRKALVEKHGYDTKSAAHLIRLLHMGIEFLTEGRLYVDRGGRDASLLLSIKDGDYTLEYIQELAESLFVTADGAYIASPLPAEPDRVAIEQLMCKVLTDFYFHREV